MQSTASGSDVSVLDHCRTGVKGLEGITELSFVQDH